MAGGHWSWVAPHGPGERPPPHLLREQFLGAGLRLLREAATGLDIDVGTPEDFAAVPEARGDLRPFDTGDPENLSLEHGTRRELCRELA